MQIILTHDQADFDAISSMLGAYLQDDHHIPVLPRKINRNVQSFLELYGSELPFQKRNALPKENIDRIILVDTQALITLKGQTKQTKVHVVDHHAVKDGFPEHWTKTIESIGACTTLFVEHLMEHRTTLSVIHATLLMLGIYEDTGSLSYISTSPRDIKAAAYLLEMGANLRIINKFLNPPLSTDQYRVYHRMLEQQELITIKGQLVLFAYANAEDMIEEISSIAHKIRDQIEPDALFMIAKTTEGFRLVARSRTERINVNKVANLFGGGGHDRAAGALIDHSQVDNNELIAFHAIKETILDALPEIILPPVSVGQIMSRDPMLITPETPLQSAATLMQRFGYEGYPVISGNKIAGLLTRRAVDRALMHGIEISTGSLMEAGEVFVYKNTPLEDLQRLMSESGWGQIPVIDQNTQKVIGIVTRTDVLSVLASGNTIQNDQRNLSELLEKALPPTKVGLLKIIAQTAYQNKIAAYIVGGFVRDLLLDRPSLDFDIVVEGDAINLARLLSSQYGGKIKTHARFGTAKWEIEKIKPQLVESILVNNSGDPHNLPDSLDLITARTEFYTHPTALPTVERGSIKLDLHRRDFSINTLALRLDGRHYGELYDYWGGLNDLQQKRVRVLHSLSFVDDPTRMLRAIRFEQRFDFHIEDRTLELMNEALPILKQISGQRLRHEFDLIFSEQQPQKMMQRLDELKLLSAIHRDLQWTGNLNEKLRHILFEDIDAKWPLEPILDGLPIRHSMAYLIWFLGQNTVKLQQIISRFRFPNQNGKTFMTTYRHMKILLEPTTMQPSTITSLCDQIPLPAVYAMRLFLSDERQASLDQYASTWRHIKPGIDGHGLRERGISPGPIYKEILSQLKAAWIDGYIKSSADEARLLNELINQNIA
ncbi:MAG: CBS domain-containing protein [Anaerolineaceae bacterium]|nr:CBS domain-containing protein [Anaerolineaceae bacterium]